MIMIPKYQTIEFSGRACAGVAGLYDLTKGKNRGYIDANSGLWIPGRDVITGRTGWFGNIITNYGMNALNDAIYGSLSGYFHVGTGTTAPVATDTTLETWVASSNTNSFGNSVVTAQGSAPYYGSSITTKRFGEGVAEGTISEVGCGDDPTNINMYSRALVTTAGGSPTTIAVAADEWLDVAYDHRLYPDHILSGGGADDGTGTIAFSGTNYDYVIRPAIITNVNFLSAGDCRGKMIPQPGSIYQCKIGGTGSALGAATAGPTGSNHHFGTITSDSYSTDTFTRDSTIDWGLSNGNETGGIVTLQIQTGQGGYQLSFDLTSGSGGVPKDGTKVASYTHTVTWARATIP